MDNELLGRFIKYYDYLGDERFGYIAAIEPYYANPDTAYIYIEDEDMEYNTHEDMVNGIMIKYAEIRISEEVYFDNNI